MHVGFFESIGFAEYFIKNIFSHEFVQALLLVPIMLRGLRSLKLNRRNQT